MVLAKCVAGSDSLTTTRAAAHKLSHRLVSQTFGLGESSIFICRDRSGAPKIAVNDGPSDMHISVSHSHEWIAVGVSKGVRIGVDVEPCRPRERRVEISDLLGWQLDIADDDDFHAKWTLWEASTKCASGSVVQRCNDEFESLCAAKSGTVAEAGQWKTFNDQLGSLFFSVAMHGGPSGSMLHRDLNAAAITRW